MVVRYTPESSAKPETDTAGRVVKKSWRVSVMFMCSEWIGCEPKEIRSAFVLIGARIQAKLMQ
jgi:hypothetical protein